MPPIPTPVSSSPGMRPEEGAGRLVNCFAEKAETGARYPVIWRRSAGLRQGIDLNTSGHIHMRGGIILGAALVGVFDTRVYAIGLTGTMWTATDLGALAGSDPVTTARNNAGPPYDVVCVSESGGCFNLFSNSAPTAFADADLPQPNSVSSLDGYFLWTIGDGRIFASELNSVDVHTNSFTTEQNLGTLLRGVTFRGEWYAFGQKGCGVYKDIGTSPFPLQRQFEVGKGIAGTYAVAGWEEGWIKQLIWVGEDGVVYQLNGYTPQPISLPDVARDIERAILAGAGGLLEATVYMQGNHAFWRLTWPDHWTWEFNATTQNWHQRESYGRTDCRASCSVWAFNRWVQGDRATGKVFQVDDTYYHEDGQPLVFEIETGIVANFPGRLAVHRADFDFETAVGVASGTDPIETDPTVQISWSRDGGYIVWPAGKQEIGAAGQAVGDAVCEPGGQHERQGHPVSFARV